MPIPLLSLKAFNGSLILFFFSILFATQTIASVTITPLPGNIIIKLDSTGNSTIALASVANITGATANAQVAITPATVNCANLGPLTVTVSVTDINGSATQQILVTVVSPLKITYPLGIFYQPSYRCVGLLPDFSRIVKTTKNCSTHLTFTQSVPAGSYLYLYTNEDTLNVTLKVTDNLGNSDSTVVKVVALPTPDAVITVTATDTVICAGQTVTFNEIVKGYDDANGYWQINKDTIPGAYHSSFTTSNLRDGDNVSYTIITSCEGDLLSNIIKIRVKPVVAPALSLTESAASPCPGDTLSYAAVLSYQPINIQYAWLLNGLPVTDQEAVFNSSLLKNGDILVCQVTGNIPCGGDAFVVADTATVHIAPVLIPAIRISPADTGICAGSAITFTSVVVNAGANPVYSWQINGKAIGVDTAVYTTDSLRDGEVISCVLANPQSCHAPVSSNSSTVKVGLPPVVTFGRQPVIEAGASLVLEPEITGNIATYNWSPGTGLNNSTIRYPVATPDTTTTYTIAVTTPEGCNASASITVTVLSGLKIPNAFTPNGDGINDSWNISGIAAYPDCTVKIYDRYGQIIFQSTGYGKAWDGRLNGMPMPGGVYYYIINLDKNSNTFPLSGCITVLR